MSSWWRRNRLAVVALPVAAALAMAAASIRVRDYWWTNGPHAFTAGSLGTPIEFSETWRDDRGSHERALTLTVTDVSRAEQTTDTNGETRTPKPPPGVQLWRIDLAVKADPDVVLEFCNVSIVDQHGRETKAFLGGYTPSQDLPLERCVPDATPGPGPSAFRVDLTDKDKPPRPPSYTVPVYLYAAADAQPRAVRVWWDYPHGMEIVLPEWAPN